MLHYTQCRHLIKEADVLLFKGKGIISWLISRYTNSPYSHVALAHWGEDKILYALEFREFKGSRIYPLSKYVTSGEIIDVFRCVERISIPYLDESYNNFPKVLYKHLIFDDKIAKDVTKTALDLIGMDYGWWNIVKMAATYIPFIRLHKFHKTDDDYFTTHAFVCSTLVTFSYRKNFIDPVPLLADRYTSPGDIARSALFYKIFELRG